MRNKQFKVATITFHWATNYGAVLQAFALQKHLKKQGVATEIIDYNPFLLRIIGFVIRLIRRRKKNAGLKQQEVLLKDFRNKELILSKKHFFSRFDLKRAANSYDAIIAGSDQIWNNSFVKSIEKTAYFLDFAGEKTKRIAYAVSFGRSDVDDAYVKLVKEQIAKFSAISVREKSGLQIVSKFGLNAQLVCDPTVLLTREDYLELIADFDSAVSSQQPYFYMLHGQKVPDKIYDYYGICNRENKAPIIGLYEWLAQIKNAKTVITNSFHGVMLSVIFNTPFVALVIPGSGMNDRLYTLLDTLNLSNRLVADGLAEEIENIDREPIDWEYVNKKLEELRENGSSFLRDNLSDIIE